MLTMELVPDIQVGLKIHNPTFISNVISMGCLPPFMVEQNSCFDSWLQSIICTCLIPQAELLYAFLSKTDFTLGIGG